MSVQIVLLTHENIGSSLLQAARTILNVPLPDVLNITANYDCKPAEIIKQLTHHMESNLTYNEFLILTDLFGSTPCNIAQNLQQLSKVNVISGLNLSMLLRTLNYAHLELDPLTQKALSGGQNGIVFCNTP